MIVEVTDFRSCVLVKFELVGVRSCLSISDDVCQVEDKYEFRSRVCIFELALCLALPLLYPRSIIRVAKRAEKTVDDRDTTFNFVAAAGEDPITATKDSRTGEARVQDGQTSKQRLGKRH